MAKSTVKMPTDFIPGPTRQYQENAMSNAEHNYQASDHQAIAHEAGDSKVDAIAAVVLITVVIVTAIFWLTNQ